MAVQPGLRVNITIVYEHTVCATSAFSMCILRVVFNIVLFLFLNDVANCRILFCSLSPKAGTHIVNLYFKRSSVASDIPKFMYKVNYM